MVFFERTRRGWQATLAQAEMVLLQFSLEIAQMASGNRPPQPGLGSIAALVRTSGVLPPWMVAVRPKQCPLRPLAIIGSLDASGRGATRFSLLLGTRPVLTRCRPLSGGLQRHTKSDRNLSTFTIEQQVLLRALISERIASPPSVEIGSVAKLVDSD